MSTNYLIAMQLNPLVGDYSNPDYGIVENSMYFCTGQQQIDIDGTSFLPGFINVIGDVDRGADVRRGSTFAKMNNSSVTLNKYGLYEILKENFSISTGLVKIYIVTNDVATQLYGGSVFQITPDKTHVRFVFSYPGAPENGSLPTPTTIGHLKYSNPLVDDTFEEIKKNDYEGEAIDYADYRVYLGEDGQADSDKEIFLWGGFYGGKKGDYLVAVGGQGAGFSILMSDVTYQGTPDSTGAYKTLVKLYEYIDLTQFKSIESGDPDFTVFSCFEKKIFLRFSKYPIGKVFLNEVENKEVVGGLELTDSYIDVDGNFDSKTLRQFDSVVLYRPITDDTVDYQLAIDTEITDEVFQKEWVDPLDITLAEDDYQDGVLLLRSSTADALGQFEISLYVDVPAEDRDKEFKIIADVMFLNADIDKFSNEVARYNAVYKPALDPIGDIEYNFDADYGANWIVTGNGSVYNGWQTLFFLSSANFKKDNNEPLPIEYYSSRDVNPPETAALPCLLYKEAIEVRLTFADFIPRLIDDGVNPTYYESAIKLVTMGYEVIENLNVKDLKPEVFGEKWGDLADAYDNNPLYPDVDPEFVPTSSWDMVEYLCLRYLGLDADWVSDMHNRDAWLTQIGLPIKRLQGGFTSSGTDVVGVIDKIAQSDYNSYRVTRSGKIDVLGTYQFDLETTNIFNEGSHNDSVKIEQVRGDYIFNEIALKVKSYKTNEDVIISLSGVESDYEEGDITGLPPEIIDTWISFWGTLRESYQSTKQKRTWSQTHFFIDPAEYATEEDYYLAIREWLETLFAQISRPHRTAAFDVSILVGAGQELFRPCALQSLKWLGDETLYGMIYYIRDSPSSGKTHIEMYSVPDKSNIITAFDEEGVAAATIEEEGTGVSVDEEVV